MYDMIFLVQTKLTNEFIERIDQMFFPMKRNT